MFRRFNVVFAVFMIQCLGGSTLDSVNAQGNWPAVGNYEFSAWPGPALNVFYSVPPRANANTPILIVIPGARRDAELYRNQWDQLATANHFITLVPGACEKSFPTEYEYNLGGVMNSAGEVQPEEKWLFSAIDLLFDDFKKRFGSSCDTYDLYGHSAGGGFVHRFLLFKPAAKVKQAVAANPAFVTMPNDEHDYPFGLHKAPLGEDAVRKWFDKRLVLLLGDLDTNPRTKPLSNGPMARLQGPHVFGRGLNFFRTYLATASKEDLPVSWRVVVVPNVGHSNAHMASHAVKYLCLK